ncbi:diguanylate cyclase [Vibrio sp. EA2]|uniref:diguanylate cyclase n=1 Tax=Vibrio sp. EA2 TaxID=3079860 RepID=UPI002948D751|nr:diguanylate cyclase [Vibrio sp. EA2]MDV6251758.1 diguanylate cyclase [Vibrio sp. EA2]
MLNMDRDALQAALQQLEQAIYNHEQWSKEIIRSIVCQLPFDSRDVLEDAHCHCRFGQWYYGSLPLTIREHPAFLAIENEHRQLHQYAGRLLLTSTHLEPCSSIDYDNFHKASDRLQMEVSTLKKELEESINNRDVLTGAENRISMLTQLRATRELVKRGVQECGIVLMDLDYFKSVNDTYGHAVGDQALVAWVRHIKEHLRPYDKVYRYGGEEFLLTFPTTNREAVFDVVERLRTNIPAIEIDGDSTKLLNVTASFGIAMLEPNVSVEETIDRADRAMYAAKKAGRNRCCYWDTSMTSR